MNRSVIHIGANKTATTTLQRALFSKHSELQYLGEDCNGYADYSEILNSMIADDDLYYPADRCADLFVHSMELANDKTFLYSSEDVMTSRVPLRCAQRLKSMVPDAKILLVIRNQLTAIPSFYVSHGAFLKPAPPAYFRRHVNFDDWMSYQVMFIKYGALASFFYHRFVSVYANLFGSENVHVLLFEEFIENRSQFMQKLCRVLEIDDLNEAMTLVEGVHERKRITSRALTYNRIRTSIFWGRSFTRYLPGGKQFAAVFQSYLNSGPAASQALSTDWEEKIFDLYAQDNSSLAAMHDLPLESLGYPVA